MDKGISWGGFFDPGDPLFWVAVLFVPLFLPIYLIWLLVDWVF